MNSFEPNMNSNELKNSIELDLKLATCCNNRTLLTLEIQYFDLKSHIKCDGVRFSHTPLYVMLTKNWAKDMLKFAKINKVLHGNKFSGNSLQR